MWMRDTNNGILSALYGPSRFVTKIGKSDISITEQTNYPFEGKVTFLFNLSKPAEFPFSMRIPDWASNVVLTVNGEKFDAKMEEGVLIIKRQFKSGDKIVLSLPLTVKAEHVVPNGICFLRGPILFSLPIEEKQLEVIDHHRCSEFFPAYNIYPVSAWNYAISEKDISSINSQCIRDSELISYPWDQGKAPLSMSIKAYRVPEWKAGITTPELPDAGFQTLPDPEVIKLVPYGTTRLRVTVFPIKKEL